MRPLFIIITLTILSSTITYGQTKDKQCNCPKNDYTGSMPDTTFKLSNGKKIVLCGYKNPDSKQTNYSEFVLAVCGQTKIINFWDATETCYLKTKKDTLFVENLVNLPTGKNRIYKETVWATDKIFFKGPTAIKIYTVNKQISKYTRQDIAKTLKEYETSSGELGDKKMELANRLFVATISGDKKARKYFREFRTRFGKLDGAFSEEYRDLTAMLGQWDKQE
jgi:hypothetical protein